MESLNGVISFDPRAIQTLKREVLLFDQIYYETPLLHLENIVGKEVPEEKVAQLIWARKILSPQFWLNMNSSLRAG